MQPNMTRSKLPMASILSDLELFLALKRGQPSALEQIYDRHGDNLYGLAFRILKNQQEAEDLIQEVFVGLWRNCTYKPERGSLKSFLMLVVRSRAIDRLRSRKPAPALLEPWTELLAAKDDTTNTPLNKAVSGEISQRVQKALSALPTNQRQALELAYFEGLSQTEIAERMGAPVGTVKSWFRLSFTKLRYALQDLMN
jgi:RNA polymerase sigma-70 factor, ECF subfamily